MFCSERFCAVKALSPWRTRQRGEGWVRGVPQNVNDMAMLDMQLGF
jgi:hypothetical protein